MLGGACAHIIPALLKAISAYFRPGIVKRQNEVNVRVLCKSAQTKTNASQRIQLWSDPFKKRWPQLFIGLFGVIPTIPTAAKEETNK